MITVDFVSLSINSSNIFSLLSALQFEIIWEQSFPSTAAKFYVFDPKYIK